jgi:hypothetical protein
LTQRRRVNNRRLLEAEAKETRVPLAVERAIPCLERLLTRVEVVSRRGYHDAMPVVVLSMLEHQVMTDMLDLLKLKQVLQHGGGIRHDT